MSARKKTLPMKKWQICFCESDPNWYAKEFLAETGEGAIGQAARFLFGSDCRVSMTADTVAGLASADSIVETMVVERRNSFKEWAYRGRIHVKSVRSVEG